MAYRVIFCAKNANEKELVSSFSCLFKLFNSLNYSLRITCPDVYRLLNPSFEFPEVPHSSPLLYHPHLHFIVDCTADDIKYFITFLSEFTLNKHILFDVSDDWIEVNYGY